MHVKIEKKDGFKIFGIEKIFSMANGSNYTEIPKFWDDFFQSGEGIKLQQRSGSSECHGVMCYKAMEDGLFPYMIFAMHKPGARTGGYTVLEIPPQTYAIFECSMDDIQLTWKRIFEEWFPTSGYECKMPGAEFEFYHSVMGVMNCEIWIPLVEKDGI